MSESMEQVRESMARARELAMADQRSMSARTGVNMILEMLAEDDIDGDGWGVVMSWWFAICGVMEILGIPVPSEWGYWAGAGGPVTREQASRTDEDGYPEHREVVDVLEAVDSGRISEMELVQSGYVMEWFAARLEARGESY